MKKYISEFIGTMMLVIFGCGSAVGANTLLGETEAVPPAFSTLLTALAFGLSFIAMAYLIGSISGCHFNPAVSFGMLLSGRMRAVDFAGYIVSQFLGGIAGAAILMVLFNSNEMLGANGYDEASALGSGILQAFIVEVILTFVFVSVFLAVTAKDRFQDVAGLLIGLTLTLVYILGIPFTGASGNPARSFGPALLSGGEALQQVWLFIIAPLVGAAIAAILYRLLLSDDED